MATKKNAFDALGDILDSELGAFDEYPWMDVSLTDIVVSQQIREVFEDEDNSISDLSDSIEDLGFFQNVVLRPIEGGKYEMVAGERRYRAAKLAGLSQVHAYVRAMTDEQMERIQFAENIHRKNFELFEEAKRLQKLLDKNGGEVAKVLAEIKKPHAWFSKRISMLKLPEQAKRLVRENVTADVEVVNSVVQIEKHSPAKAKEVVDKLKDSKGKIDARKIVKDVKDQVKPPKPVQMTLPSAEIQDKVADFCGEPKNVRKVDSFFKSLHENDIARLTVVLQPYYSRGVRGDMMFSLQMLDKKAFAESGFEALQFVAFLHGLGGLPFDIKSMLAVVVKSAKNWNES